MPLPGTTSTKIKNQQMTLQGVDEFFTILMDERMEIRIAPAALDGSGKPVELDQTT